MVTVGKMAKKCVLREVVPFLISYHIHVYMYTMSCMLDIRKSIVSVSVRGTTLKLINAALE